jgi:DNA-binding transcriptional regulator YdaS (Cro superfamily)
VQTLRRAVEIVGGEQELALRLLVTPSHLAAWLDGMETPPGDIFLRAVDLVMQDKLRSAIPTNHAAEA